MNNDHNEIENEMKIESACLVLHFSISLTLTVCAISINESVFEFDQVDDEKFEPRIQINLSAAAWYWSRLVLVSILLSYIIS